MGKYGAYERYKDSGVEWLGEIPGHWEVCHIKRLANVSYGVGGEIDKSLTNGINLLSLPNVTQDGTLASDDFGFCELNESEKEQVLLRKGDLLFNWRNGSSSHLGKTAYFDLDGEWTHVSFLLRIRFNPVESESKYFQHMLNGLRITGFFLVSKAGVNNTFNLNELNNLKVICPPLDEQQAIAQFLDYKTKQIDDLIEKKEALLEKLDEKRTALISHAVTKGLDPDVPMKDSGIEWLGEIPGHWEVKKLKFLVTKIGSGKTPKGGSETYVDSGIMLIRSQNVHDNGLRLDDVVYIDSEIDEMQANSRVFPNDILLNITGASIGRVSLVPCNLIKANVNQHVCIFRPDVKKTFPPYLHLLLCSKQGKEQIFAYENGTSREGLTFQQAGNLIFATPPLDEQTKIAQFLDQKTEEIDQQKTKIQEGIKYLKEYRTALITNAVTGKIDVRQIPK